MRKLHVVGFTSDLDGLIFSTRKGSASGSFVVPISEELYEKLAEAERLRNGGEQSGAPGGDASRALERESRSSRPESALTPREIQARLRAGRSIDEVAREARVNREWVERFAAPIIAEQAQIVELARGQTFSKPRRGPSSEPLGRSVARNLVERGVRMLEEEFDAGWSAYQLHDGVWMVQFQYTSRARLHLAAWELESATGRLTARDRLASDLAYVDASRRRAGGEEPDEEEPIPPQAALPPPRAAIRRAPLGARPSGSRTAVQPMARPLTGRAASRPRVPTRAAGVTKRTRVPKATRPTKVTRPTKATKAAKAPAAIRATTKRAPKAPARPVTKAPAKAVTKAPARPVTKAPARAVNKAPAKALNKAPVKRATAVPPTPPTSRRRTPSPEPAPEPVRAERPKIGTDGTQLAQAAQRPRPRTPSGGTATAIRSRSAASPPPAPARRNAVPPAAPSTRAGNGSARPPRPMPPPQVPRPYEPRSQGRSNPSQAPAAPRPSPRTSPAGRASAVNFDEDVELEGEPASTRAYEVPVREVFAPRQPARVDEDDDYEENDEGEREDRSGGHEAFVIRPRISAKQASELAFDDRRRL